MRILTKVLSTVLMGLILFGTYLSLVPQRLASVVYSGTAWFINDKGYLVTAYHVIEGMQNHAVSLNGKLIKAKVIAIDKNRDIAILRIDQLNTLYLPVDLELTVGEDTRTYGYPVTHPEGVLVVTKGQTYKSVFMAEYRSTALACPGNSGGPVIGQEGVIGIVNYGMPMFDKNNCSTNSYGTLSYYVVQLAVQHNISFYTSKLGFNYKYVGKSQVIEVYAY